MAVSMTSTHLHACQHHNRGGGASATRMPVTTLQQQSAAGNTSIPPPGALSSTAVLPSGHILASHHQHYNPGASPSIQHQPMMSIPPPGAPTGPPLHSAPPPLPPPPLPPGVPPPLLGIANISPGAKIVQHGHQNHRMTGHHRHSSNQPRSSSHQRSSNSSSSSASAAPRNNSFDPNFHRSKNNTPNNHPKSASSSSKKKSGSTLGGQNHQNSNKFGHLHGNVGNNNLRVPPQSSNKMPAGAQVNMHSGKVPKEYGVNNNSKGKVTTMKAPPSHYVVVQRHGQNMENHRHQSKQSPKFIPEKNKARHNGVPIAVSLAGNSSNMPFVSVSAAGVISHHHGPPTHSLQPQVNHQTQQVIHGASIAAGHQQPTFVDSNNIAIPMIPVVSAAPLVPEKLSPVTFQPNQTLPSAKVSTGAPVSVSVAAINSNGLIEFSHPQQEQHQYITNQVPLDNFKTGTTNTNLLVAAQNGKSNIMGGSAPNRETKEKTPMCLINELARFNKMQHQYRLTDEAGPAHKKSFTVCLKLGDSEEYIASGPSIKKAQHAAAAIALEKTSLKHPPPKTKTTKNVVVTPTVELNALAMKRGEPTVYSFLTGPNSSSSTQSSNSTSSTGGTLQQDQQKLTNGETSTPSVSGASQNGSSKSISQLYNQKFTSRWSKGSAPRPTPSPNFVVSLKVGSKEFVGEGSTAQAAKHSAATKALQILKNEKCDEVKTVKSTLNPASVPFVPGNTLTTSKNGGDTTQLTTSLQNGINSYSPSTIINGSDGKLAMSFNSSKSVGGSGATQGSSKKGAIASSISSNVPNGSHQTDYDDLKSPISLVHESALKRNHTVHFDIVRETGPPHMRIFITKCIMGEFITQGEGNGKKTSKKRAAELMVEKLKTLPPIASCHLPSTKKKAQNVANKKKSRNLIKIEQKSNPEYGQNINPISRLIQIQQAKKEKEPVYTLIAERGMPRRREFVMQVNVAGEKAQGTGPNKKLAKRAAAESLLQSLGYFRPSAQPGKPALKNSSSSGNQTSSSSSMNSNTTNESGIKSTSIDKPNEDSNGAKNLPSGTSISTSNGEKPKKLTFVDDLIPEKKQNSTTRTTISGGRTSSASNVMCKPLTKTNSTSSQQSPKLIEPGNKEDVTTTRSNTSGNTSLENELKPILADGSLSENVSSSKSSSNSSGMSSSSSISSSSSSSPLPTTKSSSNSKKGKNEKKEEGSKVSISSVKKPTSNGSTNSGSNKSSSSNNHQEETVKNSNENCTNKKNSSDKKKSAVNCNGNTKNNVNSVRDIVQEKGTKPDSSLPNIRSKKSNSFGGSVKQPPTAIEELNSLASMLDFSVTYTNFPQKNKTDIVTLVKLTTNPPKVCHGSGKTTEESQTDAASRALLLIADTGLENGNCVENDDGATKEEVTVATNPPKSSAKSKPTSKS